jgi:uncharacterized protein GlcG (DUF336 family)
MARTTFERNESRAQIVYLSNIVQAACDGCGLTNSTEDKMPRQYSTLTLAEAKRIPSGAEARSESLGIACNIAVVDAGGHLLAFSRQDGALIGSIDLAIDKASTARIFDRATSYLATLAQSGNPLFGIHNYQLSHRRADAVVSYLQSKYTVPPHKCYLVGIGKDQQVASEDTSIWCVLPASDAIYLRC